MTPEEYIIRLVEASSKKLNLLENILRLTREQSEVINEDFIDRLEDLVRLKQADIDEIDKIDEGFNVYYEMFKRQLKIKNLDDYRGVEIAGIKELQKNIGNIMSTLKQISDMEGKNKEKITQLMDHIGGELKKLKMGKRVNNAYAPKPLETGSYYIDKKK